MIKLFLSVVGCLWMASGSAEAALTIETWQTPKGAQVLYARAPELPMVDVRLVFDAGSTRDGSQKGIAYLTNDLIGMGDAVRDEESFAQESASLGMQFSSQSFKDMALINFRSVSRPEILQPALAMAAAAIRSPRFDRQVLERERAQLLTALQAKQQSPSAVSSDRFWKTLYGQHPYATPSEGLPNTVKTIKVADLNAFYHRFYTAKNAVVAIVGQVDRATAEAMAIQLVDGLPVGQAAPPLPEVQPPEAGLTNVDFPATQTQIVMGQVGITRSNPDYVALYLANHILGGSGFASRLMEEVREKRGLVYGVSSSLIPMRQSGPWLVSLQTATNNAPEALKVSQDTIMGLLNDISQAELDEHKDNIVGSFALETDSNKDIVGYLAMMGFYHLPINWLNDFPNKIAAVSREELMRVIKQYLQPDHWTGVLVGKPATATATPIRMPASMGGHH